ncbi:hypothetical protein CHS0354_006443, partial [Potamilus streckersoni]
MSTPYSKECPYTMREPTATTTTTATTTKPSAKQTTKLAPITPTQTRRNDNGMKLQGRQTPIKNPPYCMHHQEKQTTTLKFNQSTKSPDINTALKSGQKPTSQHYPT